MMDIIEIYINRFIRYMSRLGLEEWQLRIIFLILITLLILVVIRKWKRRARVIHPIQDGKDPGIIGKKLYSREASHTEVKDKQEYHQVSVPEKSVKEEKPEHRQSANVWEKAEEQISQLKEEITKHKQTEENLRKIIDELEKSNPQTLNETTESRNTEHYTRPESFVPKNIDLQLPEVNQNEQAGNGTDESGKLVHTNNQDRGDNTEDQKDRENSKKPGSPLDANELKAIAELAKRLGGNNHSQQ